LQARLIRELDRDVTYTEALNLVLLHGFVRPWIDGWVRAYWKDAEQGLSQEDYEQLLKDYDMNKWRLEGVLDMLPTV
jgi:hypothetical protein